MKDNRVRILAALLLAAGCAKSGKTADVAQDSILVKDAGIGGNKTDTANSNRGLQPPKRVNPTPVLPGRESTSAPVTQPSPTPKKDSTKGDTLSLIF
jgi:hypothetical protein